MLGLTKRLREIETAIQVLRKERISAEQLEELRDSLKGVHAENMRLGNAVDPGILEKAYDASDRGVQLRKMLDEDGFTVIPKADPLPITAAIWRKGDGFTCAALTITHPNGGCSEVTVSLEVDGTYDVNVAPTKTVAGVVHLFGDHVLASLDAEHWTGPAAMSAHVDNDGAPILASALCVRCTADDAIRLRVEREVTRSHPVDLAAGRVDISDQINVLCRNCSNAS